MAPQICRFLISPYYQLKENNELGANMLNLSASHIFSILPRFLSQFFPVSLIKSKLPILSFSLFISRKMAYFKAFSGSARVIKPREIQGKIQEIIGKTSAYFCLFLILFSKGDYEMSGCFKQRCHLKKWDNRCLKRHEMRVRETCIQRFEHKKRKALLSQSLPNFSHIIRQLCLPIQCRITIYVSAFGYGSSLL